MIRAVFLSVKVYLLKSACVQTGRKPHRESLLSGSVTEALAAVYRTIVVGLEGNLAGVATVCAGCVKHLTSATFTAACLELSTAITASLGLMLKALLCVKLLLTGGEYEFLSAVLADQSLVCVHSIPLSFRAFLHI